LSSPAPADGEKLTGPRSPKGAASRARLLDAAKAVFEEDGFLEARILDISVRAGLSHGSFYHYFESKEQIFREVAKGLEDQLSLPLSAVIFDTESTLSAHERVRLANRSYLQSYQREARIMGVIEQVSRYDAQVAAVRLERQRDNCAQGAASIRQLQRHGMADPDLDADIAAPALFSMMSRFAELWLVQGFLDIDLEAGIEQLTILFANAVKLRDTPDD
jgi:AcrR family transcriptional regulator